MKQLIASTLALAVATGGAAFGGSHANQDGMGMDLYEMQADLIRTRDITGGPIYTMNEADDEGWEVGYTEVGPDWNQIGEIEDVILSRDGRMVGVVAEIGGFLDIGDKHVMIPLDNVRLVPVDDRSYSLVTRYSEEQLEELRSVDEGFWN